MALDIDTAMFEKTMRHPCYSGNCTNGRIHLPVAPACNISCNYCNRKFDCVNESRPGVASEVLSPAAAAAKYRRVKEALPGLTVVGIAGPGDALANFSATEKTLRLIREFDKDVIFCLSTNGLLLERYAERIKELGVTHVTVTINTVNPKIGARIYKEVNYGGQRWRGIPGAELLLEKQLAGLIALRKLGLVAKINSVLIRGLNDEDVLNVARIAKEYGVYIGNIMQLIPAPGSAFEHMPLTSNQELNEVRRLAGAHVTQMFHCQQCRADAIGQLGQDLSAAFREEAPGAADADADAPPRGSFTVLVTSRDRQVINQHFGHSEEFYIYRYEDGAIRLTEIRNVRKYCGGADDCGEYDRTAGMLKAAGGCDFVLTMRIGQAPRQMLE
ncbi:MAG: radical SAM protein, partial [Clostridiales Family XIII bacterium]|nr:radical SAM protein [Clostridiales Family XIII bacterium]